MLFQRVLNTVTELGLVITNMKTRETRETPNAATTLPPFLTPPKRHHQFSSARHAKFLLTFCHQKTKQIY